MKLLKHLNNFWNKHWWRDAEEICIFSKKVMIFKIEILGKQVFPHSQVLGMMHQTGWEEYEKLSLISLLWNQWLKSCPFS